MEGNPGEAMCDLGAVSCGVGGLGRGEWGAAAGGAGALRAGLAYVLFANAVVGGADGVYRAAEGEGGNGGVSLFTAQSERVCAEDGGPSFDWLRREKWRMAEGGVSSDGGCE